MLGVGLEISAKQMSKIQDWASSDGHFRRLASSFRNNIQKGGIFPPEPNRYHLYISHACPWANRTHIVRNIKGLQNIISISVVNYLMLDKGWSFPKEDEGSNGATIDHVHGFEYLSELYFKVDPDYKGRFTVPVLFDKKTQTIVNNESSEIMRMFNQDFDEWSTKPGLTFYPTDYAKEIDSLNMWIYDEINNGVYKTGFAEKQGPYEENCFKVFNGLAKVEIILSKNQYLVGDVFTEADIRLFTTIVRFDPVYHTHFRCNLGTIAYNYPNILRWAKNVFKMEGVKETINMEHIKKHYYMSHTKINPLQIVPLWNGPDLSI